VYDAASRRLHWAGGGHPPALAFENGSRQAEHLGGANQIIGIMPDVDFKSDVRTMPPGSRMYLYSDGAFEVRRPGGKMIGLEGLGDVLAEAQGDRRSRVERALHAIQRVQGSDEFVDDFSLLEVEFA
jgi:sigma-B regulation protein RsbU (phosphoserine phosphatase)